MAFIVCLVLMSLCLTASDYAGLSFDLTRSANDEFKNPTAKKCDWQAENKKFCKDANSRCFGNCCQCTCDYATSTFVRNTMKCQNNDEIRKGKCFWHTDWLYTLKDRTQTIVIGRLVLMQTSNLCYYLIRLIFS